MGQTISIAPVSRIEGHARINIRLDAAGQVDSARLHVQEFRGFESFCCGRPYWEMPGITSRICGICPVSHALTAAQAGERIMGIEAPPAAQQLRRLLLLAQLLLSHSLSFFHLSGPDIVLGLDSDPGERNIVGLARHTPELIRNGIRLRQIAQQVIACVGGEHLHPEHILAGGMKAPLAEQDRSELAALMPEADRLVSFAENVWQEHKARFLDEMGEWPEPDGLWLGLVNQDNQLDHNGGRLRFCDHHGTVVRELAPADYAEAIRETCPGDSYMKPTAYVPLPGKSEQSASFYRAGPLARLQSAALGQAPRAEQLRIELLADRRLAASSLGYHQARLVEMCYAVERMTALLADPLTSDTHVFHRCGVVNGQGVGITEAPRGTLIHDYRVDRNGLLTGVTLIVATGHNSRAMDQAITAIARRHISGGRLNEGLLNRIEHGIRLYDPCLSCATHMHGRLGISLELHSSSGDLLESTLL